jgi:hypothetical protein
VRCLENFYASSVRETILGTRIENWLPIDTLDSFAFEGTTVYVAPDFALKNTQGNALLIDWKTGARTDGDRVQIVCWLFAINGGGGSERAVGNSLSPHRTCRSSPRRGAGRGTEHIRCIREMIAPRRSGARMSRGRARSRSPRIGGPARVQFPEDLLARLAPAVTCRGARETGRRHWCAERVLASPRG